MTAHTPRIASENAANVCPPDCKALRKAAVISSTRVSIGGLPPTCLPPSHEGVRCLLDTPAHAPDDAPLERNQPEAYVPFPNSQEGDENPAPHKIQEPAQHRAHAVLGACLPEGHGVVVGESGV